MHLLGHWIISENLIDKFIGVYMPCQRKASFSTEYSYCYNSNIGFKSDNRIYIKENLTPSNYRIFRACAAAKRTNQLTKYYTRDGLCYVTLPLSESPVVVRSLHYLNEILGTKPAEDSAQSQPHSNKRKRDNEHNNNQQLLTRSKKRRNQRKCAQLPQPLTDGLQN
ncbi:hypothetical protein Bhyg_08013 [Pseudolycoriella hygida]|uniref:Uncharacterized protein n=1 Tax=Pseudolycoriella hygida TaxID=35572 RepID=A0A9Q0N3V1_9DIPT|nr:hypothetical protein Bhyg_08013 [Pseudolycoriella hygida]